MTQKNCALCITITQGSTATSSTSTTAGAAVAGGVAGTTAKYLIDLGTNIGGSAIWDKMKERCGASEVANGTVITVNSTEDLISQLKSKGVLDADIDKIIQQIETLRSASSSTGEGIGGTDPWDEIVIEQVKQISL